MDYLPSGWMSPSDIRNYVNADNSNNEISKMDLISLDRLANVKIDEVIDIYYDGTVSEPYKTGKTASFWRTTRWAAGFSQNRDDIPHLRNLMQRTFIECINGRDSIKFKLVKSLIGLNNIKKHYELENKNDAADQIANIIEFTTTNLTALNNLPENLKIANVWYSHLHLMEASTLGLPVEGTQNLNQGIEFEIQRINQFLFLEKKYLSGDDFLFLNNLKSSLENSLSIDKSEKNIELILNSLDSMPADIQSQIGVYIPFEFKWKSDNFTKEHAHVVAFNICKEANGNYTASQSNAGAMALGIKTLGFRFHLNTQVPMSLQFPTIVEFKPLNRQEAHAFLSRIFLRDNSYWSTTPEEAKDKYNNIFKPIDDKQTIERIPYRRAQVIGNCGIRNIKELMIYSFQKAAETDPSKLELANKFFNYAVGGQNTLGFEAIKPLNKL